MILTPPLNLTNFFFLIKFLFENYATAFTKTDTRLKYVTTLHRVLHYLEYLTYNAFHSQLTISHSIVR